MKRFYIAVIYFVGMLAFSQTADLATINGYTSPVVSGSKKKIVPSHILLQYEKDSDITIINRLEKGIYSKVYLSLFHRKDLYDFLSRLLSREGEERQEYSLKVAFYWYIGSDEHLSDGLKELKVGRIKGNSSTPFYISFEDSRSRSNPNLKHSISTIYLSREELTRLKSALFSD